MKFISLIVSDKMKADVYCLKNNTYYHIIMMKNDEGEVNNNEII